MKTKVCTKCKKEKSFSEFYERRERSGGDRKYYRSWCKTCCKKERKKYNKEWRKLNPLKNSKRCRKNNLKFAFGLSVEEYDQMFFSQNGVCAICGKPETIKNQYGIRRLSVDHNHQTNEVRGLLCFKCNALLGYVDDDIKILFEAINYLNKTAKPMPEENNAT